MAEQTTQPRLYKRGNDDINLDEYIRNAESEFDFWLANSRLKDQQKKEVRDAYAQLLQGISDNTVHYKIGGGYNNSIGINNASKGFDAAGLAAGFLGNILRQQRVYTAPTTPKTKYEGAKTIGADALKSLLGEAGNIQYFINQDELINGKRGHTNRIKLIQDYLNNIATNWDNYFKGYDYTPEQKEQWFNDYNKYGKNIDLNQNGFIDENEYLGLSKLFGINNIEQLLYTGQSYNSQPQSPQQQKTYQSEEEYLDDVHPRSTQTNFPSISLTEQAYPQQYRYKLNEILYNLSDESLMQLIQDGFYLDQNGKDLNTVDSIRKGFGGIPGFTNNFIIKQAVETARRKNILNPFDNNSNFHYIPITNDIYDRDSTGMVYQISQDGNHKLSIMDRRDIPFFTNQWHNEFTTYVPVHKNGGILKFDKGGYLSYETPYIDTDDLFNISLLNKDQTFTGWKGRNNSVGVTYGINDRGTSKYTDNVATGTFGTTDAISALKKYHDSGNIGLDVSRALEHIIETDGRSDLQTLLNSYNANVSKLRSWQKNKQLLGAGTTGQRDNNRLFNWMYGSYNNYSSDLDDELGSSTYERIVNAFESLEGPNSYKDQRQFKLNGFDENVWMDNAGYLHIGEYGKVPDVNPTTDTLDTKETPDTEEHSDLYKRIVLGEGSDEVDETNLPPITEKYGGIGDFFTNSDLLGAGRLWASLYANNRVYKTILPSLKPVLKDTYERFSPVTGAFSAMQLKNRQGADVLSQSHRPFTSDASLAAARMLEGQKYANQLQTEGFLVDDQEIKRTKAEALARTEDNMARRSEVANFNRASINQTNRERAQLKATRTKSNWQSVDNFLAGLESKWARRAEENRQLSNQFREQIAADNATRWYNRVMEDANKAKDDWIAANTKDGVTPDITTWGDNGSLYTKYNKMRQLADDMKTAMLRRDTSNIYGIRYTSPYTDDSYNNFIKWSV